MKDRSRTTTFVIHCMYGVHYDAKTQNEYNKQIFEVVKSLDSSVTCDVIPFIMANMCLLFHI